jgi:hypothetical protein
VIVSQKVYPGYSQISHFTDVPTRHSSFLFSPMSVDHVQEQPAVEGLAFPLQVSPQLLVSGTILSRIVGYLRVRTSSKYHAFISNRSPRPPLASLLF